MALEDNTDLHRSMGRLEGKVDLILSNLNTHLLEDTARFDKIHVRQDTLDSRQDSMAKQVWMAAGGLSVLILFVQNFDTLSKLLSHLRI